MQAEVLAGELPGQASKTIEAAIPSFAVIVPTLNAGPAWTTWLAALAQQDLRPQRVLVIDSSSDDDTVAQARAAGHEAHVIARSTFNHGATRQLAAHLMHDVDVLVYMTQDAILASPDALRMLVCGFRDRTLGAAFGRQLPRLNAAPIEAHARLFNYPASSHRVLASEAKNWGIKAPFLSNSFAAYRREALLGVGGFPSHTIQSEDMFAGARLLQGGWNLAYVAESPVYHSHDYDVRQEFQRYFDIGVFHSNEPWIRDSFGRARGEGLKFVRSEMHHLLRNSPAQIPAACMHTVAKVLGFALGLRQQRLPRALRRRLSMQKYFWDAPAPEPATEPQAEMHHVRSA